MTRRRVPYLLCLTLAAFARIPPAQPIVGGQARSWLDQAPTNWNQLDASLPTPTRSTETRADVLKRCRLTLRSSSAGQKALEQAGWIARDPTVVAGTEVVAGFSAADGMCRDRGFNVFVFVKGRFAGTLSPVPMNSREDGALDAFYVASTASVTAKFRRYRANDPLCCPSSHTTVRYEIRPTPRGATVAPVDVEQNK